MSRFATRWPSPSMIIALLALFVALGGTGYAALKLPKNTVGTKQLKRRAVTGPKIKRNSVTGSKIKDNSVTGSKIKDNSVTGPEIKDNSVAGTDIDESTLGTVPAAGRASDSAALGGAAPEAYARRSDFEPGRLHLVHPNTSVFACSPTNADAFCDGADAPDEWRNTGAGYAPVGYRKDSGGWVHLEGLAAADGNSNGNTIFYLPEGYRPSDATHEFVGLMCGATQPSYVDIHTNGEVYTPAFCAALDGITFHP